MSPTNTVHCPRCGAPVGGAPGAGPCPACLMSRALASPGAATDSDALELPCTFGGYRLDAVLGTGGMGTVYDAEHLESGRRVALKMLDRPLESADIRQRFLREGRLAASIDHPNSLYVFGSEEIDDVPVITMEVAPGGTLHDALQKRGPLPVAEAVDAVLDVLSGLGAAHAAGVLHRDIKPSNCFVGPDGAVKIGDFGLSVSTLPQDDSYTTADGVVMGTPAFAAPEQLRGDELDERADLYSVGATLFTLLTGRAPFAGENVVQLVANVIAAPPQRVGELRDGVPPALERVVGRCLEKEPAKRFADCRALRDALLPFGSRAPVPAALPARMSAGWIDWVIALVPAYLVLMAFVGAERLVVRPFVERSWFAARYHLLLLAIGVLYFAIAEGVAGAGVGKRLRGLQVVRPDGRSPGIGRALLRALLPIACVELVRVPLTMAVISTPEWTGLQTALFVVIAVVAGCIPVALAFAARRERGFATVWDLGSGTRVVVRRRTAVRAPVDALPDPAPSGDMRMGPYEIAGTVEAGRWLLATDPVLRRRIWLLRRNAEGPSRARRDVARSGRLRWLQEVRADGATWDAFEAPRGVPFSGLVGGGRRVPWGELRHWLHDLASELWAAARDGTLPAELGLDHVWITTEGRAVLLDTPWPGSTAPAAPVAVGDVAGQQRFLAAVAGGADASGLPLHASRMLRNLAAGRFEKLGFLAGTLRELLDRQADVGPALRAGSLFLLPGYTWIALVVGRYHDKPWDDPAGILLGSALAVLGGFALFQLLSIPLGATAGQSIFRLAVVDANGEPAGLARRLARWAVVWPPLVAPLAAVVLTVHPLAGPPLAAALAWLALWIAAAAYAAAHPRRGLQERLTGTWIVRT